VCSLLVRMVVLALEYAFCVYGLSEVVVVLFAPSELDDGELVGMLQVLV
jgi:hypothetical protein